MIRKLTDCLLMGAVMCCCAARNMYCFIGASVACMRMVFRWMEYHVDQGRKPPMKPTPKKLQSVWKRNAIALMRNARTSKEDAGTPHHIPIYQDRLQSAWQPNIHRRNLVYTQDHTAMETHLCALHRQLQEGEAALAAKEQLWAAERPRILGAIRRLRSERRRLSVSASR